jgi:hypothetical protein
MQMGIARATPGMSNDHKPFGRAALRTALVVGTTLTLINHPDILRVPLTPGVLLQCLLNFVVPFLVAGYSRYALLRRLEAPPTES